MFLYPEAEQDTITLENTCNFFDKQIDIIGMLWKLHSEQTTTNLH